MISAPDATKLPWCLVVADPSDGLLIGDRDPRLTPVQYHSPDAGAPLVQRALHRATSITTAARVLLTALEECREHWEPLAWFVKPANRFVCDHRAALQLSAAAAILSIADRSPSEIVIMMPARCYVAHEWILKSALQHGLAELPLTYEGIITLGMRDIEDNDDEDYLVVSRTNGVRGLQVDAFVRRPVPWVAAHLKREGALVASGVLIGYAGAFASYISKMWPGLSGQLAVLTSAACAGGDRMRHPSCDCPRRPVHAEPCAALATTVASPASSVRQPQRLERPEVSPGSLAAHRVLWPAHAPGGSRYGCPSILGGGRPVGRNPGPNALPFVASALRRFLS